jgi:UDP-N-acetylmuramate--alanine ligase
VHLTGVAGVGMSALAEALMDAGAQVSGSDRLWDHGMVTGTIAKLQAQGCRFVAQDGSAIDRGLSALVVSTAIEQDNPEIAAAHEAGVPIRHRSDVLAELVRDRQVIAVAGTSGKSTTTAMLGALLVGCGLDPAVVNGAAVVDWRSGTRTGSVRRGAGDFCVVEVDESDRSLLRFHPRHAILTNAGADHFDLDEALALFKQFRDQVSGCVVDGIWGAVEPPAFEQMEWGSRFVWQSQDYAVPLPGVHNAMNAWQAVRLALELGLPPADLARALAEFRGVERRLELVGRRGDGVAVVDDYAHNTDKLRAAWRTLSAGHTRVLGLWRPHGYGPLRNMMDELEAMFAETLRTVDRLYLLPVYDAGGTANRSVNSDVLAARLLARKVGVIEVEDHAQARAVILGSVQAGDVIGVFGARDPELPVTARVLAGVERQ